MTDMFDEMVEQVIDLVRLLAPLPDVHKRLLLKQMFAGHDEEVSDVMRGVDMAKMRLELKKMQRSPQKYARKMP